MSAIVFPKHEPYSIVLPWLYEANKITAEKISAALQAMKPHVKEARKKFGESMTASLPYSNKFFRGTYLIAYFPYNIEPVFHALATSSIDFSIFLRNEVTVAFFGGGPCPELLGFCIFLKKYYPNVKHIKALVFDKEKEWGKTHKALEERLLPYYWGKSRTIELKQMDCDVVQCMEDDCSCEGELIKTDIIIAQNILTEVFLNKEKCLKTFNWIFKTSSCKVAAFVDSINNDIFQLMREVSEMLYKNNITKVEYSPVQHQITPNFSIPLILKENIFDGSDGLIPKKYVKFNSIVMRKK